MINVSKPRYVLGWVSAALVAGVSGACSGASDSETAPDPQGGTGGAGGSSAAGGSSGKGGTSSGGSSATGGTGGATGGTGGTGGTTGGTGGAMAGSGGAMAGSGGAMAGSGGAMAGSGGGGDACAPRENLTIAVHVVINVTWPDTLATVKGSGQVHIWNRSKYEVNGSEFSGETSPCGSVLPPLELSVIAGGGKALIEIPDATWDLASMPKVAGDGEIEGWSVGSKFITHASSALVGLMMAEPMGAWPAKGAMVTTVDHDNDTKPGILGVSKSDGDFVRPPTSILGQAGAIADQVYLVTRTALALDGVMTSCTDQEGTVDVPFFDNHVVGCHVFNGGECDATQADFIDTNRTIFEVVDATYTAKFVDEDATCADVRAALPQ
jgi:hypothetical protein